MKCNLKRECPASHLRAEGPSQASLNDESIPKLLALHVALLEELRARGVLLSENNPTGDFAEYLFCAAYGWAQASNSEKGFDAIGNDGNQVKGRRITIRNSSRQLSAIRDLDGFDTLAAVLFDDLYRVVRAAMVDGRSAPPGSRHGSRVL